jgi:hypothetical protein
MYAAAVDRAAERLRELRREEVEDGLLASATIGCAVSATHAWPALALPLLVGGLVVGALAVRAVFSRWELVDRLLLSRDAYTIPEVRRRAEEATSIQHRRSLAAVLQMTLGDPFLQARLEGARADMVELVAELRDDRLTLDPFCAVTCEHLLSDAFGSPLLNPTLPAEDIRSRVRQIRAGFADAGTGATT